MNESEEPNPPLSSLTELAEAEWENPKCYSPCFTWPVPGQFQTGTVSPVLLGTVRGQGERRLGENNEDEKQVRETTAVMLPFKTLFFSALTVYLLPEYLQMKRKSILVFGVTLPFSARTAWCVGTRQDRSWHMRPKSQPPGGGQFKMHLCIFTYVYEHR